MAETLSVASRFAQASGFARACCPKGEDQGWTESQFFRTEELDGEVCCPKGEDQGWTESQFFRTEELDGEVCCPKGEVQGWTSSHVEKRKILGFDSP